ncbi:O-antigen ligase family protein [Curvibacter sp. HBC61]|uniref:O-antigen ligase family protein n=1 Tax=Curvibacter cyanobacteriorum TaxID=3026422 RepID=A0ABT5MSZ0_9BURK|nr:O-antigen ligase family protein [Curvibacter sp. HBC61]MDD0837168.1 O-antigen ligase family protein [Curvibacter sp. HBC61]
MAALFPDPSAPQAPNSARPLGPDSLAERGLEHWLTSLLMVLSLSWALLPAGLSWDFGNEGEANLRDGNFIIQLQWSSLFLIAGVVCLRRFLRFQAVVSGLNPFLLALFVYCLLNISWSLLPLVTMKKVIQFGGLLMIGVAFQVSEMSHTRWLKLTVGTLLLFQVASLFAVVLIPDIAIEYTGIANGAWQGGAWRGVTDQKNNYGILNAFAAMAWVALFCTPKTRLSALLFVLMLGFCGVNLVMSKSTTSLLVTVMGIGFFLLFRWKYVASEFVTSRVLVVLACLLVVYLHALYVVQGRLPTWDEFFKPVADLLGKSTDISGRFEIWDLVLQEIDRHRWQGIGYGAFWLGKGSASQPIIDHMYWVPFQAHNGYLDVLNELGGMGLLLFTGFLVYHLLSLYRLSRFDASEAAFHGALIAVILVHNATESSFLRGVNFLAILVIFSSIAVNSSLRRHQQAALLGRPATAPSPGPGPAPTAWAAQNGFRPGTPNSERPPGH